MQDTKEEREKMKETRGQVNGEDIGMAIQEDQDRDQGRLARYLYTDTH
jgi:hypothetical protein